MTVVPRRAPAVHPDSRADACLRHLDSLAAEEARRRRLLAHAVFAAALLHLLVALLVPRPATRAAAPAETARELFRVVVTPRFAPPPPTVAPAAPRARRVPMPDPTPDEPEPLRALAPPPAELPLALDAELGALPAAPPPLAPAAEVHVVGGEVAAPAKLFAPQPDYPEVARRVRKQGTVVLRLRLDATGAIVAIEPLTALGFGLEEAAAAAVSRWRFAPASFRGEAVPVVYNLSVRFALTN
jgi:protein TonB